jgi:hypothetical protein
MSIFCCCTPIVLRPPSTLFACARPPLCFSLRVHCPHCREIHDRVGLLLCDLHHLLDTVGGGCACFVRTSIYVTVRHSLSPCICVTVRHPASPCVTCITLCLRAIPWSRHKLPPLALATSSHHHIITSDCSPHPITSTTDRSTPVDTPTSVACRHVSSVITLPCDPPADMITIT